MFSWGKFDGYDAKVVEGNTGDSSRVDIYYGGEGAPDGPGHGHAVIKDVSLDYVREPNQDGADASYDSKTGAMNWGDED